MKKVQAKLTALAVGFSRNKELRNQTPSQRLKRFFSDKENPLSDVSAGTPLGQHISKTNLRAFAEEGGSEVCVVQHYDELTRSKSR